MRPAADIFMGDAGVYIVNENGVALVNNKQRAEMNLDDNGRVGFHGLCAKVQFENDNGLRAAAIAIVVGCLVAVPAVWYGVDWLLSHAPVF